MTALFSKLDEYIRSDEDHRRRVAERNKERQTNQNRSWQPLPYNNLKTQTKTKTVS